VLQPEKVNLPESLAALRALDADVFVVAAYGQILSRELLEIPRRGAINVHASLLPRHRGASPVEYAILSGDVETGVSIIQILPALDAGPILAAARTPIGSTETAGKLEDRLAAHGAQLIPGVLDDIAAGTTHPIPQDPALVTRAPKLKKQMGAIDWSRPAAVIERLVRALQPWPLAYAWVRPVGKDPMRVLILEVRETPGTSGGAPPGSILRADKQGLTVQTGTGALEIVQIQPEGKRVMAAAEFLNGYALRPGDRLERDPPAA
jgi:methionyl-tRNA formyltransferase